MLNVIVITAIIYASGVSVPSVFDYYDVLYDYIYVDCEDDDLDPECEEYYPDYGMIGLAPKAQ